MKTYFFEAKTIDDAIKQAVETLNITEDNLIIKS